jgi:hypothetical protein
MKAALFGLFLMGAAHAAPYSWSGTLPKPFLAPTDQIAGSTVRGASLQGGLVDIRYGQVSVDLGGTSEVLEADEGSVLTLDGAAITAEELVKRIPEGLAVAVRYNGQTGKIGWLDAFSRATAMPGAALILRPWKGPAYAANELVTVTISAAEAKRLGPGPLTTTIPGVAHDLPFVVAPSGGMKAVVRVMPGWDFVDLPVFLKSGKKVYKGGRLNFSTSAPAITGFGPHQASAKLATIPGWVDLRSESRLLDPATAKLTVSQGARVVDFQPRVDRTVFAIEADGAGEYWLEFSMADHMGRQVSKRWPLRVQP